MPVPGTGDEQAADGAAAGRTTAGEGHREGAGGRPAAGSEAASRDELSPPRRQAASAATEGGGTPVRLRYTRRRVVILGGAFIAGLVAVVAGLRSLGDSAVSSVGGALSDQFGAFPVRSVEDVPDVPPEDWTIAVDGLVEKPLTIDHAAWSSLQRLSETVDFNCVEGWTVDDVRWGGVAPKVILDEAGPKPEATHAVFHAYGGVYSSSLPLELVDAPATVLADRLNGEALPPKHGGPIRLVVPDQLGYKSVKWVERIELTDGARAGYWEKRGYPQDAPVPGG